MTAAKRAQAHAPSDYTQAQRLLLGLCLLDIWDYAGFASLYDGEERRYMPRLLVGSCVAALRQRPLTMTDAFFVMDAKHGKTAAKYVGLAESQGYLKRVSDPKGDKRKTILVPTEKLFEKFNTEMARMADDFRDLLEAVANGAGALPTTGAADIEVKRRRNTKNRHIIRITEEAASVPRNRLAVYNSR